MLLVIDIGNTETVLGLYRAETLCAHWRMTSKAPRTADECAALLQVWWHAGGFEPAQVDGIVISSVVPSLTMVFVQVARILFSTEPLIIGPNVDHGLTLMYDTPRLVGADRICNAVGGLYRYGAPLIVVDFGTATTFDVVTADREYLGGVIALGLMGISHELHRLSAKLPRVDLEFPPSIVGRTTETSIQSGIMWGTVSLVEGMIRKIVGEMGWDTFEVVATGGIASILVDKTEMLSHLDPHLTLEGMRIIYQRMGHVKSQ